ncbi:MAG: hypothetical protein VX118_03015 [Candidatus Thermoplasmatota archaeon]|nr:hypothetical protein [Candidatus Thermoplasmatota archaeon]
MFEIIKPCQNCKSYVLKPKKKVELNLKDIMKNIEELSIEVLAFTGSMLSIRKKCKINIYNSGKIVVITKDLNQVHEIAKELENVIDIGKK